MIAAPASRNDPCPCGSGRRYKHCHGAAAAGAAPADRAPPPADAEAHWRQVLALDPANAEAHFHLGNLLRERGEALPAVVEYEHALAAAPGHAGILNNLGLALEAAGEHPRAERCYRDVLARDPAHADALGNLANLRYAQHDYAETTAIYDRLFAIRRDAPAAVHTQRAIAQMNAGRKDAAEASFREALRRAPDDARLHLNLARLLTNERRYADAEPLLARALELDPRHTEALVCLTNVRQQICSWDGIGTLWASIERALREGGGTGPAFSPFAVLSMPFPPQTQLAAGRQWAASMAPAAPAPRPAVAQTRDERLRVAFVCSDFREHATTYLSLDFWERIDRRRIEAFAYGIEPEDPGPRGQETARAFEHFADVSALSTARIASRIRADRIAIAIDLNCYCGKPRDGLFASGLAPIQINYLGYAGTSGAPWYDYLVVDRFGAPEHMQPFYSERLLHLTACSFPSDGRRAPAGPPPSRAECALPERGFVFACFNNAYKILPDVFAIWMRLLRAVPGSVLWLLETTAQGAANLRAEAARAGIDPARIIFARMVPNERHMARIAAADLFVDTFPYGAHTTASDALLVGLPLVTCAGETLASRLAGSHLRAAGMGDLVTTSFADYEALALRLAQDPGELARLRARLVANRHTQPLHDMAKYAREFEDGLLRIWRERG
jgi:predicted O-linked N-acetylglucosamine transferase (SPINDLY family)